MKDGFYRKLALLHAQQRRRFEEENAFLWSRLISLIQVVKDNNHGDGSGEHYIREEADAAANDLIMKINEQLDE